MVQCFRKVKYLTSHRVGWDLLTKKFKLCSAFDGNILADIINLFESLIGNFEGIVQYNKDNRDFEGAEWGNITIDTLCNIMTDESKGSSLNRLQVVNSLSLKMAGEKCLDHTYKSQVSKPPLSHLVFDSIVILTWCDIYNTCNFFKKRRKLTHVVYASCKKQV